MRCIILARYIYGCQGLCDVARLEVLDFLLPASAILNAVIRPADGLPYECFQMEPENTSMWFCDFHGPHRQALLHLENRIPISQIRSILSPKEKQHWRIREDSLQTDCRICKTMTSKASSETGRKTVRGGLFRNDLSVGTMILPNGPRT